MKVVRRNVFETNSSSTHSISIYKWTPTKESFIPLNTNIQINGEISSQTEIKDELGKLNYIVAILASICQCQYYESYDKNLKEETFDELINNDYFNWLKELVKDKTNTDIIYKSNSNYYPYFETTYDENTHIEDVLGCDIDNETEFKNRITAIIFDENYIIEDKENEY